MEVTALPDGAAWEVDGVTFVFDYGRDSSVDRFLIRKPPELFDLYVDLAASHEGANVVELGIAAGGSTALLSLLLRPARLVACELDPRPVVALEELLLSRDLGDVVSTFYGVDQADRPALGQIIATTLGDAAADLVIDDASHLYAETRASFEVLFPRVRPGGTYIIEDWAADYAYAERIATVLRGPEPAARDLQRRLERLTADDAAPPVPLPALGVELLQAAAEAPQVVSGLEVNKHWIAVKRGPADVDPDEFRLEDLYHDPWGWRPR